MSWAVSWAADFLGWVCNEFFRPVYPHVAAGLLLLIVAKPEKVGERWRKIWGAPPAGFRPHMPTPRRTQRRQREIRGGLRPMLGSLFLCPYEPLWHRSSQAPDFRPLNKPWDKRTGCVVKRNSYADGDPEYYKEPLDLDALDGCPSPPVLSCMSAELRTHGNYVKRLFRCPVVGRRLCVMWWRVWAGYWRNGVSAP